VELGGRERMKGEVAVEEGGRKNVVKPGVRVEYRVGRS